MVIAAIICTVVGENGGVYVKWRKSGSKTSGNRKMVATMITKLSLRYNGRKVINSNQNNRIKDRGE